MKKKNLRIIGVILALTLALLVSGCGDKSKAAFSADKGSREFEKFETQDLDGNTVNQDVLENADLTVINIWGTYCGPCLNEMPDLGELSREYKDKGVQFIGIPIDTSAGVNIDAAKDIIQETKADYLHILPSGDLNTIYLGDVSAVPETLFVDKEGTIIGHVVGARDKADWEKLIEEAQKAIQESGSQAGAEE